jgi:hypothetical protein
MFQMCNICMEVFEQYWNEELEEWHLRDAIKVNNKTYHPICYEDHTDVNITIVTIHNILSLFINMHSIV